MKRGFLALSITLFLSFFTYATHIVGGGFNMVHNGNYNYSIRLTLYFDGINGSQGAIDAEANFSIYRKSNNAKVRQVAVPLETGTETIEYDENDCGSAAAIKTNILIYETSILLPPAEFSDAQGYYVMWERCCRNGNITNIISPGGTGQTFVMFFPPVSIANQPFINSSPAFKPAPNNLFCINLLNQINFSATDADGDSLVFNLVDPLNSITADSILPVNDDGTPGPYPSIAWRPGYGTNNQIPGTPGLTVNPATGILNIFPTLTGLFVFSVRCSEFRNGVKIGEIRREFQQLVIDCPPNTPPKLFVRDPNRPLNIGNNDTIFVSSNGLDPNCIQVKITDLQVGQTIRLAATALNFIPAVPISGDTIKNVLNQNDTVRLSFCLASCQVSSRQNPFRIKVVARDNGCSAALSDTLELYLVVTLPPFQPAEIQVSPSDSVVTVQGLDSLKIVANTFISNNFSNSLSLEVFDSNNTPRSLASLGIMFPFKTGFGPLSSKFEWKTPCDSVLNQPITLIFKTTTRYCDQTFISNKRVRFTVNPLPFFQTTLTLFPPDSIFQINSLDSLKILAGILDSNGYQNTLRLEAFDSKNNLINLSSLGISFPFKSGTGPISNLLRWKSLCDSIVNQPITLNFISNTSFCNRTYTERKKVKLSVNPIPIFPAELELFPADSEYVLKSLDSLKILAKTGSKLNQTNFLELEVRDESNNLLSLQSFGARFPFASGSGVLSSKFEWKLPCLSAKSKSYRLNFISRITACSKTFRLVKTIKVEVKSEAVLPFVYVQGQDSTLTEFEVEGNSDETTTLNLIGSTQISRNINISAVGKRSDLFQDYNIAFTPLAGFGKVSSPLTWKPACSQSLLFYPYNLQIRSTVINCGNLLADTILLKFKFKENPAILKEPKNLFTVNGDGFNDYFSLKSVVVPGDCELNFEELEIFNRWGKKAFSTTDPNFTWPNGKKEEGVYFYFLRFKEGKYNGWFQIIN